MAQRGRLPSQLAADLGFSHATIGRWLSGEDTPNPQSCHQLAIYAGVPPEHVLALSGHLSQHLRSDSSTWPEFREYAKNKYPEELDEDVITMVEDIIQHRRERNGNAPS